ncbi:MAG: hypothetical protein IJV51_07370 [Oscillospiraceae bacterium]|nr:hypothetical protein [Oscillospiraceae bacterium]
MKRIVSLLLVFCFCVGLAACGKSNASSASPSADASPATPAESSAPSAEPASTAAPSPEPVNIQALVDALNAEELAQRTADDPYIAVFEVAKEPNTIHYKLAMDYFQYVISTAITGEAEFVDAYNRILNSIPPIENSLEGMIRETSPELNVVVIVMYDQLSSNAAAVIDNGGIIYDVVNGIGTAPAELTPIVVPEELPEEVQQQLDEYAASLNGNQGNS